MTTKIRVTAKRFKECLKSGGAERIASNKYLICKQSSEPEVEQVDDNKLQWTISSGGVDRSKDIVSPSGWSFDNWVKGGSILWSHDPTTLPVAKPDKERPVWVDDDKVKSIAVYPDVGLNEFGNTVYRMAKEGFIRGASVGFLSEEFEEAEDRDGFMPINFNRQELLEWSHTPVPDNPQALLDAKSAGISLAPLKAWVSRVLDESVPIVGHSREELEGVYTLSDDKQAVIVDMKQSSDTNDKHAEKETIEKGVITYDMAHGGGTPKAEEDATWDGPPEVAAASVDDLMVMSAWFDSDDAENKSAYKLPHHRAADKAVVKEAVQSAIAALNGARGGVDIPDGDRAGVYTHLTRHLREDFEVPNEEIPELRSAELEPEPELDNDDVDEDTKAVDDVDLMELKERIDNIETKLVSIEETLKSQQPAQVDPPKMLGPTPVKSLTPEQVRKEIEDALLRQDLPGRLRSLRKTMK
jgi:phage head maturation protease